MPSTLFLIVGDGPRKKHINEKIKALELEKNVKSLGHREDVETVLAASDVCVLTSEAAEGVPQAVLQYLAMKKPVVATSVGSIPEVIRSNETGLLVEPNDYRAVARAVVKLLKQEVLASRLGSNGRSMVEKHFSLEAMLDRTIEIYSTLLQQQPHVKGRSQ